MWSEMVNKILILIFTFGVCCSVAKELYTISRTTTICSILDPTIVANYTCKSKNVNRTTNIGSREIIFQPGVILTNYYANLQLFRKFGTVYRPFMVKVDQDVCEIFKDDNLPVAKVLNIKERRKFGNFYDPCPISGRRYMKQPMSYEGFPDILPSGEYRFDLILYSYIDGTKRNLTRTQYLGELKTTTAEQWKK